MSDDSTKLIAAAQLLSSQSGIDFKSNDGFKAAARSAAGVFELTLDHHHGADKLVINVTQNGVAAGSIVASPVGTGSTDQIQVNNFDAANEALDGGFYITIWRVRD